MLRAVLVAWLDLRPPEQVCECRSVRLDSFRCATERTACALRRAGLVGGRVGLCVRSRPKRRLAARSSSVDAVVCEGAQDTNEDAQRGPSNPHGHHATRREASPVTRRNRADANPTRAHRVEGRKTDTPDNIHRTTMVCHRSDAHTTATASARAHTSSPRVRRSVA